MKKIVRKWDLNRNCKDGKELLYRLLLIILGGNK